MWSRCSLAQRSKAANAPDRRRAPRPPRPRARSGTKPSRMQGARPRSRQGRGGSTPAPDHAPGPCRHSRSGGSSGRRAGRRRASACSRSGLARRRPRRARRRCRGRRRSVFSASRSCVDGKRAGARDAAAHARGEERGGRGRHVLEFVGDDVDRVGEARQRRLVLIGGDGVPRGDVEGRAVRLRARRYGRCSPSSAAASASMRPSWPPPRMPMVPPGGDHAGQPSSVGRSATASVCLAPRQASSRVGEVGIVRAPGRRRRAAPR